MSKCEERVSKFCLSTAIRWLWENRTWQSSRQKRKAFDRAMKGERR